MRSIEEMTVQKENTDQKPKCKLTETDGNVFALAGQVSRVLKRAGKPEQAKEFMGKLLGCGGYDNALQLMMDYVDVE